MYPTKEEIKEWLKEKGYSYDWLAKKCFVSYNTIRNWMAKQKIPEAKLLIIKRLIQESDNSENKNIKSDELVFQLDFSPEEKKLIEEYAKTHPRFDPKTFAEERILEFCAELIAREKQERPQATEAVEENDEK